MSNAIELINTLVLSVEPQFESVIVDRSITFERESAFALQSLTASEYAMKVALANKQSVINAITNIASIGISLNPARKQAYLVPRGGAICLDISYMGMMDLAMSTGSLKWAQAALVHANDKFTLHGYDAPPEHQYDPFSKDRGAIIGVYVVVKTADGDYLTDTMTIDAVYDIRDRSSAWKAWVDKKKSCPWVTDEGEMIKKTVVKRAAKYWPRTERLESAIRYLNEEGGEGLAPASPQPGDAHTRTSAPSTQGPALLNEEQIKEITELAKKAGKQVKDITAAYKVSSLAFIAAAAYEPIITRLNKIIETNPVQDVEHV